LQSRGGNYKNKDESSKKPAAFQTKDPYEFKGVEETMNILMKGRFPRVLDSGDQLD
jgi:hypothetical protein